MSELAEPDADIRSLSWPIAVRWRGIENSLKTIDGAIQFLTSELQHLAATSEWRHAISALDVAYEDYTPLSADMATQLVEDVCKNATILKNRLLANQLVHAATDIQ
jgi:hypothetical protein